MFEEAGGGQTLAAGVIGNIVQNQDAASGGELINEDVVHSVSPIRTLAGIIPQP